MHLVCILWSCKCPFYQKVTSDKIMWCDFVMNQINDLTRSAYVLNYSILIKHKYLICLWLVLKGITSNNASKKNYFCIDIDKVDKVIHYDYVLIMNESLIYLWIIFSSQLFTQNLIKYKKKQFNDNVLHLLLWTTTT